MLRNIDELDEFVLDSLNYVPLQGVNYVLVRSNNTLLNVDSDGLLVKQKAWPVLCPKISLENRESFVVLLRYFGG